MKQITPETILATKPDLSEKSVKEAMIEFAGIKITEAVEILAKKLPHNERYAMLNRVDDAIHKVLTNQTLNL